MPTQTKVSDEEIAQIRRAVLNFLSEHEFISNRLLREVTNINYDQAIYVFGVLQRSGDLTRIGKASATRYALAKKRKK
jgi:hypothetical protein